MERLEFSQNWNNKLLCFNFTTIRPVSKKYETGLVLDIRIKDAHLCYAKVVDVKTFTLQQISDLNFNLIDSGLKQKDFFEFMHRLYSKKSWWKEKDTNMNVVFFEKISQLDMFDDNNEKFNKQ